MKCGENFERGRRVGNEMRIDRRESQTLDEDALDRFKKSEFELTSFEYAR